MARIDTPRGGSAAPIPVATRWRCDKKRTIALKSAPGWVKAPSPARQKRIILLKVGQIAKGNSRALFL
jgi:hypothetical protein